MTPNQADQQCTDPGPELVDWGDFGWVEGAKASQVLESGVGFAGFAIGFFEAPAFIAFGPAIRAFGNQFRHGASRTTKLPGIFAKSGWKFR